MCFALFFFFYFALLGVADKVEFHCFALLHIVWLCFALHVCVLCCFALHVTVVHWFTIQCLVCFALFVALLSMCCFGFAHLIYFALLAHSKAKQTQDSEPINNSVMQHNAARNTDIMLSKAQSHNAMQGKQIKIKVKHSNTNRLTQPTNAKQKQSKQHTPW